MQHKKQLHERIEARKAELTSTLESLKAEDGGRTHSERVMAIETSLAGLEQQVGGGWDRVGEMEADALSRWLESTNVLTTAPSQDGQVAPPADRVASKDGASNGKVIQLGAGADQAEAKGPAGVADEDAHAQPERYPETVQGSFTKPGVDGTTFTQFTDGETQQPAPGYKGRSADVPTASG